MQNASNAFKRGGQGEHAKQESSWMCLTDTSFSCITAQHDKTAWYIDSGATAHMTSQHDLITDMQSSESAFVTVANNTSLKVQGKGVVKLALTHANVKVDNVLYVPELCANLLSVSAMMKKGLRIEFGKTECIIRGENGKIQATARLVDGMFKLNMDEHRAFAAKDGSNTALWHRRLGHAGISTMQHMKSDWADGNKSCETCVLGKHAREPFGESSSKSQRALELVHTDVCGPMKEGSLLSSKYFVTFIDDFSRRVVVFCIEKKSDVYEVFKQFKSQSETETGLKLKTLRSDNGKEFCNDAMKTYLREAGIQHQTTAPYTPEQNGVSERMNRTLVEKASCMMFDAKLPLKFWAQAIVTAAYIINRIPTRSCKKSPEEIWSMKPQDLSHLRVFGCRAMMHIPKMKRTKFQPKSTPCIFVGYSSTTKGYTLYNTATGKISVSRDVKFFEDLQGADESKNDLTDINHFFSCQIRNEVEELPVNQLHGGDGGAGDNGGDGRDDTQTVAEAAEDEDDDEETEDFRDADYVPPADLSAVEMRHPSQRIRRPVERYCAQAVEASSGGNHDPQTPIEALSGQDATNWKKAMEDEYKSLIENETWTLVNLPEGRKAISNKWVFKTKLGADGTIDRYKARLVVKGCSQRRGIDYTETFSPVVRYASIRFLVAMAARLDLDIDQMDVVTAFLQGDLKEEVYMKQPDSLEDGTERVCRLRKSLYGLKQASRCWNEKLGAVLKKAGLTCSSVDTCIYFRINASDILIVAVYVDDLLIFSNHEKSKEHIKERLRSAFKMTDNGEARFILGMHIERDRRAGIIKIHQHKYLKEVLERFHMADCNPVSTPADTNVKLTKEMAPTDAAERREMETVPYQEAVGSVLFAAQVTRPDIQFAVNTVSRFNANPGRAHWNAVKRILRYLRGTIDLKLTYAREDKATLHGYCDADWGSDESDRRSNTGYVFLLQGGAVAWNSRKQQTVALSTTEAEYMAMSAATQEAIWLRNLHNEIFGTIELIKTLHIHGDNKSALMLGDKTTTFHPRTKHIDIRHHFLREEVHTGRIKFSHVSTHNMTADVLTKAVPTVKHIKCRDEMNIK